MLTPRPARISAATLPEDWHPLVKNIYASRLARHDEIEKRLQNLLPPDDLTDLAPALDRLERALNTHEPILVYGDYDVDGATATALTVRVLRQLGANVDWFIPSRSAHGYGFSLTGLAALPSTPGLILTVDNGTSSHEAVTAARARGIDTLITDHHLPGDTLPAAVATLTAATAPSPAKTSLASASPSTSSSPCANACARKTAGRKACASPTTSTSSPSAPSPTSSRLTTTTASSSTTASPASAAARRTPASARCSLSPTSNPPTSAHKTSPTPSRRA